MNSLRRLKHRLALCALHTPVCSYITMYMYMHLCYLQNVSEFSIRVSFLELYNEELFDLLSPGEDSGTRLRIFEDSARKVSYIVEALFWCYM